MKTKQELIKNQLGHAHRTLPAPVLAVLNGVRIVPVGDGNRRIYELQDEKGNAVRGTRAIVAHLKARFPSVAKYLAGGRYRAVSLATAVAAYLHYDEAGPKLAHLRGDGPGRVSGRHAALNGTAALVRRELQRRLKRMPTAKLLELLVEV